MQINIILFGILEIDEIHNKNYFLLIQKYCYFNLLLTMQTI